MKNCFYRFTIFLLFVNCSIGFRGSGGTWRGNFVSRSSPSSSSSSVDAVAGTGSSTTKTILPPLESLFSFVPSLFNRKNNSNSTKESPDESPTTDSHITHPTTGGRIIIPSHITSATDLFCNREVSMEEIEAVGFDMDFTLAQYNEAFDLLAYEGAKQKLVSILQYPSEILHLLHYEKDLCRRGCLIDKRRGNIIKMDQYRYVTTAEHGLTPLTREQRKALYQQYRSEAELYTSNDYYYLDTPFSLVDACLFVQLVDLRDRFVLSQETKESDHDDNEVTNLIPDSTSNMIISNERRREIALFMKSKSYYQLWLDMRKCIDRCHFDGVIKHTVAQNPAKYIVDDPNVIPMLESFRKAGKKVFLLTNSLWDYSNVVMNYVEGKKTGNAMDLAWTKYFDLIIVGGNKPAFLNEEKTLPLYRISPEDGTLQACEYPPETDLDVRQFLSIGKYYQGGNFHILHKLLGVSSGNGVLYVGDHIYADILRSKRTLGWRTCLVVPELSHEMQTLRKYKHLRKELMNNRRQQYLMESELDSLHVTLYQLRKGDNKYVDSWHDPTLLIAEDDNNQEDNNKEYKEQLIKEIEDIIRQKSIELERLRMEIRHNLRDFDNLFHSRWGQLFKAGFQDSRISKQIKDFACIYTSKASNLGLVSSLRPFRPPRDKMPHDHIMEGLQ